MTKSDTSITPRLPTGLSISLLWATLMGLYIYNDYFSLYLPGTIERMSEGRLAVGPATEGALVIVSLLLAIPAVMIFLSATLPAVFSRWINFGLGIIYTAVEILTLFGSPLFYQIIVTVEIAVTLAIVWYALRWPKTAALAHARTA